MTSKQYIKRLTAAEKGIRGKDVPQKSCARVIDGLCDVIASKDGAIAEKDTAIYLTLIGSCNMLGIEPYKYFEIILPRLREGLTTEQLTAMLPYKVAEEFRNK